MLRTGVLSDEMWARVEPLLPSSDGKRGGRWRDHRLVMEAIAWRFRTGTPWRDLPAEFGPFQTVWKRHDLWSRDGTYDKIVTALQADADLAGELDWVTSVDSTVVRAHQHAAGARRAADPSPDLPAQPEQDTEVIDVVDALENAEARSDDAAREDGAESAVALTGGFIELQEFCGCGDKSGAAGHRSLPWRAEHQAACAG